MNTPAITAHQLCKRFRLGAAADDGSLRDAVQGAISAVTRRLRTGALDRTDARPAEFWALRDVSFTIPRGQIVGIVGANGAGKSTLLKILSRIIDPTEGHATVRGRVGSLLEVGTGFHPELTGRENVYLSGAILGMTRREINSKFDRIAEFAQVNGFLDTPVKNYSSGMFVRLAFAVAAHLEPEILIIDEVLAVGDVAFQRKCLGRMEEAAGGGRTVLFVSHNMSAVRSLCQRCLVLDRGRLVLDDTPDRAIRHYLDACGGIPSSGAHAIAAFVRPTNASPWMTHARVLVNDESTGEMPMGSRLAIEVAFKADRPVRHPRVGLVISTDAGEPLLNGNNRYQRCDEPAAPVTSGTLRCELGEVPLMPGRYRVALWLGDHAGDTHAVENALRFEVSERDLWGHGKTPPRGVSHLWWPMKFQLQPNPLGVAA